MWKNKHLIVALLVAPVLALIAYFAVDNIVSEKPHAAVPDASYKLAVKSNCRYASGSCDLKNGDFELTLTPGEAGPDRLTLVLQSKFPLRLATLGVAATSGAGTEPIQLASADAEMRSWSTTIATPRLGEAMLQIAVVANSSSYYAEVPTVFLAPEDGPDWTR